MPERGDIVILTPRGKTSDYIKRVIGLPGDTLEMDAGTLYINGREVKREPRPPVMVPVDANVPCNLRPFGVHKVQGADGKLYCRLPVDARDPAQRPELRHDRHGPRCPGRRFPQDRSSPPATSG